MKEGEKIWKELSQGIKQAQSHSLLKRNTLLTTTLTGVVDHFAAKKANDLNQTKVEKFT